MVFLGVWVGSRVLFLVALGRMGTANPSQRGASAPQVAVQQLVQDGLVVARLGQNRLRIARRQVHLDQTARVADHHLAQ